MSLIQSSVHISRNNLSSRPYIISQFQKLNTSKYKFYNDSKESCSICFEKFNHGQSVCVNSCYHYWCDKCESKFTNNLCPFCRKTLEPNLFLDSKGETRFFQKTEHQMKIINIIKNDIDKISKIDEVYKIDKLMSL